MTSTADWLLWSLAGLAVLISFANPGGFIIGAAIAFLLLGGRYGLPFIGDYIRTRQTGVGQAKAQRKIRDTMRRNDDERDR
ncbi:hypothetical protein [Halorubrum aethiopicum]|uniref:hypothetical protein n=1 Tax=Halorubrum aethiopicum TaxID=1758255 RepID=UPI0008319A39|nr:hypothetical protein [Halorubrum aethiopicum]